MFRIDTDGSVNGQFSDGSPQNGQLATYVGAEWLNAVQEEIASVIGFSGLALNKADSTQLRQAIVALIAGVVGTGGGSVPTTRQVSGAGLATGGGPLAADLTITVPKASALEILAGTDDTKAITPLGLKNALGSSLGASGYYVFPGGLIIQWGVLRGSYNEGSVSVTLPTAFPTNFFMLNLTTLNQSATVSRNVFAQGVSRSLSGFTALINDASGGGSICDGLDFIAIGN